MEDTELKEQFIKWFNNEISINKLEKYFEITCPFLDVNNDYIQIYVKFEENGKIYITDDGYTIDNLKLSGMDFFSDNRKSIFNSFLTKYNVNIDEKNKLFKYANEKNFSQQAFSLMQAMMNISDMFMLSKSRITSIFTDDVKNFFKKNNIYYSENVSFMGKSGLYFSYDFLLQRSKDKPERLCKTVNNPSLQTFKNQAFMWNDTKKQRRIDSQFIVFLNDENSISQSIIDAYNNYDIKTILWSKKEDSIELLNA